MRLFSLLAARSALLVASSAIVLIAGCQSTPPSKPGPSGAQVPQSPAQARQSPQNAATRAASTKANLAIEKLRLAELFRGTPVLFVLQPDGSLRAEVPLHFSFDTGKTVVKPPLAAVLDRIATGQLNELTQVVVSAPNDPATKDATLVGGRAASVRDYLVAHGLAATRVAVSASAGTGVVRIVVTDMPAP